ncbi:thioredoxin domain-containing protein [Sphingobacterium corticis]|uniref:Thioredoxin domain-containing protein n=1 Tax=Sphingobacterium corticis TaxID=1812823 RepID=A0ABW5NJJ4_9SPHI
MTYLYALATLWPKSKKYLATVYRLLTLLLVSVYWLFNSAFAQPGKNSRAEVKVQNVKPLNVGDMLPDDFWKQEHLFSVGGTTSKKTLEAYRGKLLVIDFWASWCGPCLASFPKIDSLTSKYSDLEFLKVTSEDQAARAAHTSIIQDSVLRMCFDHQIIPHYAWISPAGEVLAFTSSDGLTEQNVEMMLDGNRPEILGKVDLDYFKPIFLHMPDSVRVLDVYSAFYKGLYRGLPSSFHYRTGNGRTVGMAIMNEPLRIIYRKLARQLLLEIDSSYFHHPFIVEVNDPQGWAFGGEVSSRHDELYNYDIEVSITRAKELHRLVLQDINRYTPYHGCLEKRKMPVYLLQRKAAKHAIKSQSGNDSIPPLRLKDNKMATLVNFLNAAGKLGRFIIDDTGSLTYTSLHIPYQATAQQIKVALAAQDLEIVAAIKELDVFVVRDQKIASRDKTTTPIH